MRCEGPVNAPCNRCESSGLPCIFEKPAREPAPSTVVVAAPASEESMARLRALEGKMEGLSSTLGELVAVLRESKQLPDPHGRALPPSGRWDAAGSVSSPVSRLAPSYSSPGTVLHPLAFPAPRSYNGESAAAWTGPVVSAPRAVTNPSFSPTSRHRQAVDSSRGYGAAPSRPWEEPSSSRDEGESWTASAPNPSRMPPPPSARPLRAGGRRDRAGGRDEDYNDEDRASYLPAESFGAPIAALRGLADAAEHHAATEEAAFAISNKASSTSSRADDVLMDERRPLGQLGKRRRVEEAEERLVDVVTSGAVEEEEARRLWRTFGRGCGRFMSVFSEWSQTMVLCICADTHPQTTRTRSSSTKRPTCLASTGASRRSSSTRSCTSAHVSTRLVDRRAPRSGPASQPRSATPAPRCSAGPSPTRTCRQC
jgi:hypothetical protein